MTDETSKGKLQSRAFPDGFALALSMVLSLAMAVSIVNAGCGPGDPTFDKATQYTPESLAQEFLFRYKGMNIKPKRAPAPPKRSKGTMTAEQQEKLATKSKDQSKTKKQNSGTLDGLLEDIAMKAETVKDSTPSKVLKDVAAIVGKDTFVPEADRKILVERIEGVAGSYD